MRISQETLAMLIGFGDNEAIASWQTFQKLEFVFSTDHIPVEIEFFAREGHVTVESRITVD